MSALPPKADICSAPTRVRFAPNSDHESGHVPMDMSALPPKADMCGATRDVRFGPKADIGPTASPAHRTIQNEGEATFARYQGHVEGQVRK